MSAVHLLYILGVWSTQLSEEDDGNTLRSIDSASFSNRSSSSGMSIEIPYELLELATNMSGVVSIANVTAGSFLYDNVAALFSGNLQNK